MARTALTDMTLENAASLRVQSIGVTRVTHIGPAPLRLAEPAGWTEVPDQLAVWQAHWQGRKAYSRNAVDGGMEFHFICADPVRILAE